MNVKNCRQIVIFLMLEWLCPACYSISFYYLFVYALIFICLDSMIIIISVYLMVVSMRNIFVVGSHVYYCCYWCPIAVFVRLSILTMCDIAIKRRHSFSFSSGTYVALECVLHTPVKRRTWRQLYENPVIWWHRFNVNGFSSMKLRILFGAFFIRSRSFMIITHFK